MWFFVGTVPVNNAAGVDEIVQGDGVPAGQNLRAVAGYHRDLIGTGR